MNNRFILVLGDLLTLGLITFIGFATHGELQFADGTRILTTFLPLIAGWFLAAPWLGLFDPQKTASSFLWRVPFTMLLAAPLTSVLRAVWLNSSTLPLFTLILGGSGSIGMLIWRALWVWMNRPKGV
jgi:hypothetical protein